MPFDFIELDRSRDIADQLAPCSEWLKVGIAVIQSEGIPRRPRAQARFGRKVIVPDTKILDAGARGPSGLRQRNGHRGSGAGPSDGTIQAVQKVAPWETTNHCLSFRETKINHL